MVFHISQKANLKTEKLPVHPKIVPTNADLKRSNMLDRYAGIRDPTFKATWDLSEIAKAGDKSGKAGSIFSFSTAKTKKTYDVAVKNPIIAAKEAEDRSGAHGGGGGGGLGGLFRRSSRASRNHPQEGSPNKSNTLIDETRDPKELLAEAEHQAAWEAQEKERKEAEQAEERERQRISQEMAKQERKRKDAEAKEQRRSEKEQEKERKRQSKAATVNTVNNGPPPRYSQAGAAGAPAAASQEGDGAQTTASDEPQHSEGHRLGDEVPAGEERPHESNFNEEFSVLDHPAMAARQAKDGDATSTSSNGSSITEEAPRGAQDSDAGVAAAASACSLQIAPMYGKARAAADLFEHCSRERLSRRQDLPRHRHTDLGRLFSSDGPAVRHQHPGRCGRQQWHPHAPAAGVRRGRRQSCLQRTAPGERFAFLANCSSFGHTGVHRRHSCVACQPEPQWLF